VPDAAAIGFRQRLADHQPEPHAAGFGRIERLEEALQDVGRQPRPGVAHHHVGKTGVAPNRRQRQRALFGIAHGLDAVADEVDEDLLDLHLVDQNLGNGGIEFEVRGDVAVRRVVQHHCERIPDDILDGYL
jgi:hypothetical protein